MTKTTALFIFALLVLSMGFTSAVTETITLDDYTIDFEYTEEDAEAGKTFRVEATVKNEAGETRTDIELELKLDDPFDRVGDDEKDIGTLNDNEEATVSFKIEIEDDAEEDTYDIEFEIRDNKDDEEDEFSVEVTSDRAELIIGQVSSTPSVISPDTDDIELIVTIENKGEGDASSVRVKLDLPDGITPSGSYTDTANLGTINAGESKDIEFFIDTDKVLTEQNYIARLNLDYESDNDDISDTLSFDIPVKGRPQFRVQGVTTSPSSLQAGSTGQIRIPVTNIGSEKGEETSIRIFENSDLPFTFNEKTNFIGTINEGSTGTGIISFEIDSDARVNNYLVKVQVRTVNAGDVVVEEHTVSIPVSQESELNVGFIVLLITIVIIILILFFVWRALRRK